MQHSRKERRKETNHRDAIALLRVQLAHVALVDLRAEHDEAEAAAREKKGDFDAAPAVEVPQLVTDQRSERYAAARLSVAH